MSPTTLSEEDKAKYIPVIDSILKSSDLSTISVKKVRNGLSEQTGIDFTPLKKSIDTVITDRFDILLAERDSANGNADGEGEDEAKSDDNVNIKAEANHRDNNVNVKTEVKDEMSSPEAPGIYSNAGSASPFAEKKRKSPSSVDEDARLAAELHAQLNGGRPSRGTTRAKPTKKATAKGKRAKKKSKDVVDSDNSGAENGERPEKKKRKPNPNNAFMKPLILSEPLAAFIGEAQMSRPEVVKKIWAYVKLNDLQDPSDRRYILCDDSLKPVFGDKVHMFTMNKVLATNMYKAEEVAKPEPTIV